jgi:hypothetical protein
VVTFTVPSRYLVGKIVTLPDTITGFRHVLRARVKTGVKASSQLEWPREFPFST